MEVGSERSKTVYSVGEAIRLEPDCTICGHPKHVHGGILRTCPIIATYRPKDPHPCK